jgi:AcrR family transcriptional regulator
MASPERQSGVSAAPEGTRERLLEAAGEVFAARGFRGATMREIAERARANLASAHYHFGSKEDLYLAVASRTFEKMEQRLAAEGAHRELSAATSRAALEQELTLRVRTMFEILIEDPGHHGVLIQRELTDPSDALAVIVHRFVDPMRRDMDRLVAHLEPELSRDQIERCSRSIVGQLWFYATHRAALLLLMGREDYPRGFSQTIAEHITRFSLGGLAAAAAGSREAPASRARSRRRGTA